MRFSPRLHPFLIERIWALDDEREPIAETWRLVCADADASGLTRPGYHEVRIVVRADRERRAALRQELLAVASESFAYVPDPLRLADHVVKAERHRRR